MRKKISFWFIFRFLAFVFFLMTLFFITPGAWAKKAKKPHVKAIPTPSPSISDTTSADDPTPSLPVASPVPSGTVRTFNWYFQHGPNCPHCQALKRQQQQDEERRQNLFQP